MKKVKVTTETVSGSRCDLVNANSLVADIIDLLDRENIIKVSMQYKDDKDWGWTRTFEYVEIEMPKANVILFTPLGKYYTEEQWEIPEGALGPHDMKKSKHFHTIDGGPVLVETQEPWGYPHVIVSKE